MPREGLVGFGQLRKRAGGEKVTFKDEEIERMRQREKVGGKPQDRSALAGV